jgi:membrane-associated phospholipid phosphatase
MATAPTPTPDPDSHAAGAPLAGPRPVPAVRRRSPESPSVAATATSLAAAAVALLGLAVVASGQRILWGEAGGVDAVNGLPDALGWPLRVVMQLGTLWVAAVVVAVVAWLTRARGWAPTVAAAIAVALAFRLDNVLKAVIERPRPPAVLDGIDVREHIEGFAFPSGHTTMAAALAAALHPTLPPRWRWMPWALVVLVGAGRLHVGVHWPLDVLGGIVLGIAIGALAWLAVGLAARQ